jgi:hypothetical protein
MMYQLLKINVSISKKLGDLTFEITLVHEVSVVYITQCPTKICR